MTDRVLKDMSRLGSALADMASQQIDSVLNEFRRSPDQPEDPADDRVDPTALAASAMQVVSKLGALMIEVSKYDLVRRNDAIFRVGGPNAISTHDCSPASATRYAFWIENETRAPVRVLAGLKRDKAQAMELQIHPHIEALEPGERRRAHVHLPPISDDAHVICFEAHAVDGEELVSQRTVHLRTKAPRIVDPQAFR